MEEFWKAVEHLQVAIFSFLMAFLISIFRTIQQGAASITEACMAGLLSVSAWSMLGWLDIPEEVSIGIAGMIGYLGTHWISEELKRFLRGKNNE